jgi:hypothetical protein
VGPERPARLLPRAWQGPARPVIDLVLSPPVIGLVLVLALTTLYKVALPIVAIGPERPARLLPEALRSTAMPVIDLIRSPPVIGLVLVLALATLYKIALPLKPPWYRGLPGAVLAAVVFLAGATGLRAYLDWLTGTGYTYGALAAPIAFLLGTFFIGMAIVLGAHFNASIQALWPVPLRDRRNRLERAAEKMGGAAVSPSGTPGETTAAGAVPGAGTVVPGHVPDVLLTPDVTVLERAVRERPDVAAAVLEQMHYGVVDPKHATANPLDGPAAVGDGRPDDGHGDRHGDRHGDGHGGADGRTAAADGGTPAGPVVGDRR